MIDDGSSSSFLHEFSWYCGNKTDGRIEQVALKQPNGYGLFDMHGNVSEWTLDTQGCDWRSPYINPYCYDETVAGDYDAAFLRGGYSVDGRVDSSYLSSTAPRNRKYYIGMRIVRLK